ncbi:MAG: hypothetical protein C4315_09115 [Chloroflexota bacterium]
MSRKGRALNVPKTRAYHQPVGEPGPRRDPRKCQAADGKLRAMRKVWGPPWPRFARVSVADLARPKGANRAVTQLTGILRRFNGLFGPIC